MALDIKFPADTRYAKMLMFSPAGHGKTHFLGTAMEDERTAPMLLLDFEGGEETLAGLEIPTARIREWDDYSDAYELLTSDSAENIYNSVGVDSVSETHIWALLERLGEQAPRRKDKDLIEIGDYGVASTQLRRLLREFRDLPMHVFYTAASKEVDERGVGKVKVPAMSGQMAEELVHLMSIVGYLAQAVNEESGDLERLLLLQNYPGFRTKARTAWGTQAPDEIVDPTVTKVLDALGFSSNPTRSTTPTRRTRRAATTTAEEK